MALYKNRKFTTASLAAHKISFSKIFEELPVVIHNSTLVNLFLRDLEPYCPSPNPDLLDLTLDPYLEKNLEGLQESLERYELDLNKHNGWERNYAKVMSLQNQYLQKKKSENAVRQANHENPLPLPSDAELNQMFKATPETSRLEPLLLQAQSYQYSKHITQFIGPSLTKLFFAGKLQQ
jgi:translation initiation factor 3 subunit H